MCIFNKAKRTNQEFKKKKFCFISTPFFFFQKLLLSGKKMCWWMKLSYKVSCWQFWRPKGAIHLQHKCDMLRSVPQMSQTPEHFERVAGLCWHWNFNSTPSKMLLYRAELLTATVTQNFSSPDCMNQTSTGLISTSDVWWRLQQARKGALYFCLLRKQIKEYWNGSGESWPKNWQSHQRLESNQSYVNSWKGALLMPLQTAGRIKSWKSILGTIETLQK